MAREDGDVERDARAELGLQRPAGAEELLLEELEAGQWLRPVEGDTGRAAEAEARKAAKRRLSLFASSLHALGGVPQLLIAADAVETGPDEAVAAVLLAHLFARVMELSTQTRAARLIQLSGCARPPTALPR